MRRGSIGSRAGWCWAGFLVVRWRLFPRWPELTRRRFPSGNGVNGRIANSAMGAAVPEAGSASTRPALRRAMPRSSARRTGRPTPSAGRTTRAFAERRPAERLPASASRFLRFATICRCAGTAWGALPGRCASRASVMPVSRRTSVARHPVERQSRPYASMTRRAIWCSMPCSGRRPRSGAGPPPVACQSAYP